MKMTVIYQRQRVIMDVHLSPGGMIRTASASIVTTAPPTISVIVVGRR